MTTISLRKVAEKAGVSGTTVSRVLNGKQEDRIPYETRERVRRVAHELGYQPNPLAQRLLRKQTTRTIGLMLGGLRNPFFQDVFEQIEQMVTNSGYQILLDANPSTYGLYHDLSRISTWLVDGALMWATPRVGLETYLGERAKGIPVVYLGHLRGDGGDAVAMDLYAAGKEMTSYLLRQGYRRLCYISLTPPEELLWPANQIPGFQNNQIPAYQDVCREAGLEPEIVVIDGNKLRSSSFQAGIEIAARPPSKRPDALICQNDWIALFVHDGLQRAGLRVPDDIAIAGFDGIEEGAYLPGGPLTTMRLPVDALCRTALDILLARIGGDAATPAHQVLIPLELKEGGTA